MLLDMGIPEEVIDYWYHKAELGLSSLVYPIRGVILLCCF